MKISNIKYQISNIQKNKIWFLLIFIFLGLAALQMPVSVLAGAKVKFTLFDLVAPVTGAFLGSFLGVCAVLLMQFGNLALHGFGNIQTDSFLKLVATLRFLPLIVGVVYFASSRKNSKLILLVPLLAILSFNLHPIGRTVWFYSLYWLIPIAVWPIKNRFLLARALGSTFTAHAAGGAVWIWAFNLPSSVWVSLVPIVAMERAIFALGISAFYILINNVLAILRKSKLLKVGIWVDKKYIFKTLNSKH